MSRYKPYPKYKESGIEWLGEVPEHWKIQKLKYIAHTQPSNVDKKSKENEQNVLLCNYTDVYKNEFITNEIDFMKATATHEQIKKFKLEVDDVIITKDSEGPEDIAIAAYVKETQNDLICGYHLTQIKPKNCNGVYLYRAFNSSGIHDQFKIAANGITRYGLSIYAIDNALFPTPPKQEQTTIANFLDRETARIDTLIEKQERLIALLAEKRQALISHAVTKGLDPNVKMKDSGVEWLGEVPEHWIVLPLKYLLKDKKGAIRTGPFGSHLKNADMKITGNAKVVNQKNVIQDDLLSFDSHISASKFNELKSFKVYQNDILITTRGTIGRTTIVDKDIGNAILHPCLIRIQPSESAVLNTFLSLLIQDSGYVLEQILVSSNSTTIEVIYSDSLINIDIAIPNSLEEQAAIVHFVDYKTAKIDTLIEKAKQAIALLKERRTALISAAVTGKIDVRGEVV